MAAEGAQLVAGGRHTHHFGMRGWAWVWVFYGMLALFESSMSDVLQEPKQTSSSTSQAFINDASTTKDCTCLKAGHSSLYMP